MAKLKEKIARGDVIAFLCCGASVVLYATPFILTGLSLAGSDIGGDGEWASYVPVLFYTGVALNVIGITFAIMAWARRKGMWGLHLLLIIFNIIPPAGLLLVLYVFITLLEG